MMGPLYGLALGVVAVLWSLAFLVALYGLAAFLSAETAEQMREAVVMREALAVLFTGRAGF